MLFYLAPVVLKVDIVIHLTNHFPVDTLDTYLLDIDVSVGNSAIHRLKNWGSISFHFIYLFIYRGRFNGMKEGLASNLGE